MNAEEAKRALDIARSHYNSNNLDSAVRFAKKSVALYSTPEGTVFLEKVVKAQASSSTTTTPDGGTSTSTSFSSSTTTSRASTSAQAKEPDKKREFTPAQAALVKKVKSCKPADYYGILGLEKGCDDSAVKKAYRKMALGLHPDKCGAPGAEEAFKSGSSQRYHLLTRHVLTSPLPHSITVVSKAFQVLSDSNKRHIFDQTGSDPDSRGGGGGGGGGGGFARGGGGGFGGGQFGGEELSPEDLFRFFFQQGGGGGNGFGGGGFTTFGGGGPGIRFQTNRPRTRQAPDQPQTPTSMLVQVAPLLILFGLSLLTQLPALFGSAPIPDPEYVFDAGRRQFSIPRTTDNMNLDYYVNAEQFATHPLYKSELNSNPHLAKTFNTRHPEGSEGEKKDLIKHIMESTKRVGDVGTGKTSKRVVGSKMADFERKVEHQYALNLQRNCQAEINDRAERLERARGFLGIGRDAVKLEQITNEKLPNCEKLSQMGYTVRY